MAFTLHLLRLGVRVCPFLINIMATNDHCKIYMYLCVHANSIYQLNNRNKQIMNMCFTSIIYVRATPPSYHLTLRESFSSSTLCSFSSRSLFLLSVWSRDFSNSASSSRLFSWNSSNSALSASSLRKKERKK